MASTHRLTRWTTSCIALLLATLALITTLSDHAHAAEYGGKVKIAAAQTSPVFRDKAGNLEDMRQRALAAAADGADLIVFPELSLTGYKYRTRAEMREDAEPVPGPSTLAMAEVAKEAKAYIAFGMVESDGDNLYDGVVLVGPEGFVGKYAKITMGHQSEAVLFDRGPSAPPVFDTSIGRIGLASCYDGAFPENARLLGLGGAQILVLIDTENGTTWRDYVRTRAVENGAFAVVANRIGSERNSTFNGFSLIADPQYNLLANASTDQVETISATVDLSDVDRTFLTQRRPELYRALTKPMDPAVLGVNADPQSSLAGTSTQTEVSFATTALPAGTPATARIVTGAGETLASTTRPMRVDSGSMMLTVPASAPAGRHELEVIAGGSARRIPFTIKDHAKPGTLGTTPAQSASASSSVTIGFDETLVPSTSIPVTLTGGGTVRNLTGRVNQGVVDNRVIAPYTGLTPGETYTATIPADAVESADSGEGNDEASFTFTVAEPAKTIVGGVAQPASTPLDTAANVAAMRSEMEAAAGGGVRFLVFPELSITGAEFASRSEAQGVAEPIDGPSVRALAEKAAELDMTVVAGLVEDAGDKLYGTSVLIGPDGVIGSHRSTQLSDDQVDILDAGSKLAEVYDTDAGPVGLVSGYENYFPEYVRSLAIRGALVVAVGASETGTVWRELARSRGSENKVYVLAANQPGSGGRSLITSTSRAINGELAGAGTGFAKATLNLTTIANRYYTYVDGSTAKARTTHYYLDRRPEIYAPISAKSASTTALALDRDTVTTGDGGVTATATVTGAENAVLDGKVELTAGDTPLGEADVHEGRATFSVPSTKLAPGRHVLMARYVGNQDLAESSGRAALTVSEQPGPPAPAASAPAAPGPPTAAAGKAVASLSVMRPTRVTVGRRAVLRVRVSAAGAQAAGTVSTVAGGRHVRAALRNGSATLRLPAFARAGVRRVVVRYSGNDAVAAAERTLSVRVIRATPTLTAQFPRGGFVRGAAAQVKVRVSAPGVTEPDGVLTVRTAGRMLRFSVRNGVAAVTLPAFSPRMRRGVVRAQVRLTFARTGALKGVTKRVTVAVRP